MSNYMKLLKKLKRELKSILLISTTILLSSTKAHALDNDKKVHFRTAAMISTVTYLGLRTAGSPRLVAYSAAIVTTLALGAFKESVLDAYYDKEDMKYNLYGATVPILIIWY